jgi:hypothetical protein
MDSEKFLSQTGSEFQDTGGQDSENYKPTITSERMCSHQIETVILSKLDRILSKTNLSLFHLKVDSYPLKS